MTLDAVGTNFVFSAIRSCKEIIDSITIPAAPNSLERCLTTIQKGFWEVYNQLQAAPVAISFAFPGPADYRKGIIGDLPNFPAFRGGVVLGPMLEETFGIPVFINNDGALFTLGEAAEGLLPWANRLLGDQGIEQHYQNLIGATLGTGLGGGIVINGHLCAGDNTAGGEMWLLRNKLNPELCAEEGASIRAVQRNYALYAGIEEEVAPSPKCIYEIGIGQAKGDRKAARKAFELQGEVVGEALANAVTLIDGLVVIGSGLSGASSLFLPALLREMNGTFKTPEGGILNRLDVEIYNLEEPDTLSNFLDRKSRKISIPGSGKKISYDSRKRVGVGISRLGTSKAVSVGAYYIALSQLDK